MHTFWLCSMFNWLKLNHISDFCSRENSVLVTKPLLMTFALTFNGWNQVTWLIIIHNMRAYIKGSVEGPIGYLESRQHYQSSKSFIKTLWKSENSFMTHLLEARARKIMLVEALLSSATQNQFFLNKKIADLINNFGK